MKPLKLDLGCGLIKQEEWVGIDIRKYPCVDFIVHLGKEPIPFGVNSFDEVKAIHLLEHLYPEELFYLMDDVWRVLKPQGFFHVEVPKADTKAYLINPDHRIQFIEDTFGYFQVPGNPEHKDPHGGVIKHHWHTEILEQPNPENIAVNMYPNKVGGKYPYIEVRL